ncbi:superoxide dismutase family protein [Sphingomonas quercus]|uniref:Superoxide dismutase [Cu-Zn] n=1 Tax=Sphingomonas quercus TaxID=2842451 RepID=A0ABS6BJH6_9SPHN|nr:superoxide dismutase family protein [Sphingomonas quercus]MBU3078458.1 superoxide dismutase family protein [Sphingomonas quercus]
MRAHFILMGTIGLALLGQATAMAQGKPGATAVLKDASGASKGTATFTETPAGLTVTVAAAGLPAGAKGFHIHMVGKCEGPEFTTAGGHWNPTSHQHGKDNPAGAHMGDMANLTVAANGAGRMTATIPGGKLSSGASPLLDADGASIMIHADPDDYKTDPSGNSGKRIACGVITAS